MKMFSNKKIALLATVAVASIFFVYSKTRQPRIRKVLLISIDTCRADFLSCYGYNVKTTSNIDALAQEGTLFENVISPIPTTLPAHSTMLTGTIPPYHGVHENILNKLGPTNVTLAEILRENDFTTGAIIASFVLNSKFGIDQGFDTYNEKFEEENIISGGINERKGGEVTRFANQWLDEHKQKDFFLFLHYYDPHHDYNPPEPFASRSRGKLYIGEIAYVDYCIGKVIAKLKELDLYDSTLIIVTADHGEMLGEHGEVTHSYFIYQSAIKVPLIVKLPHQTESKRINPAVGLVDIVPTVCGLLDIDPPEILHGVDLSDCLRDNKSIQPDRFIYCESLIPTIYNANSLLGLTSNRLKYIQTTRPELYDLVKDPQEENNLFKQRPAQANSLKTQLAQRLELTVRKDTSDKDLELDSDSRARLESLGYVAGQITEDFEFDQTKDDPKDLIYINASHVQCNFLISQKDIATAKVIADDILSRKPDCFVGYELSAKINIQLGDYAKTCYYYEKTLEFTPNNTDALINTAKLLSAFDKAEFFDPQKAVTYAARACEITEYKRPEMNDILAIAHAANGDFDKAIEISENAITLANSLEKNALATEIQKHIDLYKTNTPYRESLPTKNNK